MSNVKNEPETPVDLRLEEQRLIDTRVFACVFRRKADTDSDAKRTVIPIESGQ